MRAVTLQSLAFFNMDIEATRPGMPLGTRLDGCAGMGFHIWPEGYRLYTGSISALSTAYQLHGYGRAGTRTASCNGHAVGGAVVLSFGTPIYA